VEHLRVTTFIKYHHKDSMLTEYFGIIFCLNVLDREDSQCY